MNNQEKTSEVREIYKLSQPIFLEKTGKHIPMTFDVRDNNRGYYRYSTQHFIIPTWIFNEPYERIIEYVIHEMAHGYTKGCGHNRMFKGLESNVLEEWGIEVKYSKAYVKEIIANGQTVWKKKEVIHYPRIGTARKLSNCHSCNNTEYYDIYPGDQFIEYKYKRYCITCAQAQGII